MNAVAKIEPAPVLRAVAAPVPTLGQVMLVNTEAPLLSHDIEMALMAVRPGFWPDEDIYHERIRAAQRKLRKVARLLGYDIVPRKA